MSEERLNDGSVGYSIRGDSSVSERTKLLFCTTGVILRRLGTGDGLRDVTHIVVDEVSTYLHSDSSTLLKSSRYMNDLWKAISCFLS